MSRPLYLSPHTIHSETHIIEEENDMKKATYFLLGFLIPFILVAIAHADSIILEKRKGSLRPKAPGRKTDM